MAEDPTPRELQLHIQHLVGQVATLVGRIDDLNRNLASTYVPRGEYHEARKGDQRRIDDVEKDMADQASFRRQVAAGALVGVLLLVANLVVTLARLGGAS